MRMVEEDTGRWDGIENRMLPVPGRSASVI